MQTRYLRTKVFHVLSAGFLLLIGGQVLAQTLTFDPDPEGTLNTPPSFPDRFMEVQGVVPTSIYEYLTHFVQYPPAGLNHYPTGMEVIEFEVTKDGELQSFNVINSISPEIDQEVIRVLKTTSGKWAAGKKYGEPVTMTKQIRLVFKPHSSYDLVGQAKEFQRRGNEMMFIKKDPKRALSYYNQALRILPFEDCILCCRCLCRWELGDEEGALADLDRIMEINPLVGDRFASTTLEDYFDQLRQETEFTFLSMQ